jgi:hypothetical protein
MSALAHMLHALQVLEQPADASLTCPDCELHLDECECQEVLLERCQECWHYVEQCQCEPPEDSIEVMRADSRGYAEVSR